METLQIDDVIQGVPNAPMLGSEQTICFCGGHLGTVQIHSVGVVEKVCDLCQQIHYITVAF